MPWWCWVLIVWWLGAVGTAAVLGRTIRTADARELQGRRHDDDVDDTRWHVA